MYKRIIIHKINRSCAALFSILITIVIFKHIVALDDTL